MGVLSYMKRAGLILSALLVAASSYLALVPKPVAAAPANNAWVNRATIQLDASQYGLGKNDYYVDPDTFDDNYVYYNVTTPSTNGCQPSAISYSNQGISNDFFYANNDDRARRDFDVITYTGASCLLTVDGTREIDHAENRKITFVRDGSTIKSIFAEDPVVGNFVRVETSNPLTSQYVSAFTDALSSRDRGVFINEADLGDTNKICKDVIVNTKTGPLDDAYGSGFIDGSAMLFAVQDNAGGKTSESMQTIFPTRIPASYRCGQKYESIGVPHAENRYPVIKGVSNAEHLLGGGWDGVGDGADCGTPPGGGAQQCFEYIGGTTVGGGSLNRDRGDDSFLIYVGTMGDNLQPGTIPGQLPQPQAGKCSIPGLTHLAATDPACVQATSGSTQPANEVCRATSSTLGNTLSWIVCPLTAIVADATSWIETTLIGPLLTVNPLTVTSPTYQIWDSFRNIANVMFAIMFLVIVFSTATGVGLSNLSIKKTLPAFFVGVIAANLSFFLIAFAVDFFNVVQQGIANLATSIIVDPAPVTATYAPSGGAKWWGIGGALLLTAVLTAGAAIGPLFGLILLAVLIVFAAVLSLVFRQLLIVALAAIAPIAIVSRALPNVKLFSFWLSNLSKMLIIGPGIALLFVSGKLVGALLGGFDPTPNDPTISGTDEAIMMILIFLGYVLPLLGIPVLMVMSGSLLTGSFKMLQGLAQRGATLGTTAQQRFRERVATSDLVGIIARSYTQRAIGRVLAGAPTRRAAAQLAASRQQRMGATDDIMAQSNRRSSGFLTTAVKAVARVSANDIRGIDPKELTRQLSPQMLRILLSGAAGAEKRDAARAMVAAAQADATARARILGSPQYMAVITAYGPYAGAYNPAGGVQPPGPFR
jgi:hypothetical protein